MPPLHSTSLGEMKVLVLPTLFCWNTAMTGPDVIPRDLRNTNKCLGCIHRPKGFCLGAIVFKGAPAASPPRKRLPIIIKPSKFIDHRTLPDAVEGRKLFICINIKEEVPCLSWGGAQDVFLRCCQRWFSIRAAISIILTHAAPFSWGRGCPNVA